MGFERLSVCGQVQDAFYSFVTPSPTGTEPRMVAGSSEVAELIGLDPREFERPEFAMVFSGNAPLPGGEGYCPVPHYKTCHLCSEALVMAQRCPCSRCCFLRHVLTVRVSQGVVQY
jgi:hypothetical protein